MLKKIKLKNSTKLFIGILLILLGICVGLFEFFEKEKNEAYSEMNILLYENETPKNIEEADEEQSTEENQNEEQSDSSTEVPQNYNYKGILEIPKINLRRGFLDLSSKYNDVDYNVTVIEGSTFPDVKNNNLILAAHSGSCNYCYFQKLYKLKKGDVAYIHYNNTKYEYRIVDIYETEKDGSIPIYRDYSKNTLTLITCTRNSDTLQTVYILELYNKQNN